jgi:hypothetical protein
MANESENKRHGDCELQDSRGRGSKEVNEQSLVLIDDGSAGAAPAGNPCHGMPCHHGYSPA